MGKEMFVDDETQTDGEYKVKERKAKLEKGAVQGSLKQMNMSVDTLCFSKSLVHHSQ